MATAISVPFRILISAPSPLGATNQRTGQFFAGATGIQAAIDDRARQSGDVILVKPGNYGLLSLNLRTGLGKSITLRSAVAGQKWILDGRHTQGKVKAILNNAAANTPANTHGTIEDAHLKNWKSPNTLDSDTPNNGAAISWFGTSSGGCTLTVRNCVFEECSGGIATSAGGWVTVTIESNQFVNVGCSADPNNHSIYLSTRNGGTAIVRGNSFVWTYTRATAPHPSWVGIGHSCKSRFPNNYIQANFFDNRLGAISSAIDASNLGYWEVDGNIIIEGPNSDSQNGGAITWKDGTAFPHPVRTLKFRQNTVINYGVPTENVVRYLGAPADFPPDVYDARDNIIIGRWADVPNESKYPSAFHTIAARDSILIDANNNNFAPVSPVPGSGNWARYKFQAPSGFAARSDSDRGAVS